MNFWFCFLFTDAYYKEDVQKVIESDWYVKRFLLARGRNVDEAFKMIRDAMRWRNEYGFALMKDSDFPYEFYKIGGLFPYEKDKQGNVMIYMRIKLHRKIPELEEPVKRFIMHIVNKVDKETDGNGMGIVFDCTGAGYVNIDMDFLSFLITTGTSYFPVGLKYILVYDLPWILTPFRKIAMALVPGKMQQLIRFANKNDITEFIARENLPDYLGGTCRRNYRAVPFGCLSVFEMARAYGFPDEDIQRIRPIFDPFLEQAEIELANGDYVDPPGFGSNIEGMKEDNTNNFDMTTTVMNGYANGKQTNILKVFPPDIIQLNYEQSVNSYQAIVILENNSDYPLAFKIQSNNPNNYYVSPRLGIILKGGKLRLLIQLRNGNKHQFNDRFLLLVLPVTDSMLDPNEFGKIWQTSKNELISYKLSSTIHHMNMLDENNDPKAQIILLKKWCRTLEKKQQRLSLLISLLIAIIILLLSVLIYIVMFNSDSSNAKGFQIQNFVNDNVNKSL